LHIAPNWLENRPVTQQNSLCNEQQQHIVQNVEHNMRRKLEPVAATDACLVRFSSSSCTYKHRHNHQFIHHHHHRRHHHQFIADTDIITMKTQPGLQISGFASDGNALERRSHSFLYIGCWHQLEKRLKMHINDSHNKKLF